MAVEQIFTTRTDFEECEYDLEQAQQISEYLGDSEQAVDVLLHEMVAEYSTAGLRAAVESVATFALERQPLDPDDLDGLGELIASHLVGGNE